MSRQSLMVQVLIIVKFPRTHSDTQLSVGLLLASDKPDAVTSIWQYVTLKRDRRPCPWGFGTRSPSKPAAAAYPRFRPRDHRDRHVGKVNHKNKEEDGLSY